MHRLFGKKKEVAPPPTLDDASGSLNERMKVIDDKLKGIDNELRRYKEQLKTAKGPTANNIKKRAMETLKRKRMYETQRDQLAAQAFNVDQTSFAISTVKDSQTTIAAMKAASKELKKEHKKIDINDIENMADDMIDMMEDMNEISEVVCCNNSMTLNYISKITDTFGTNRHSVDHTRLPTGLRRKTWMRSWRASRRS